MDYFSYNYSRAKGTGSEESETEELVFTGDEVIEVDEDHTVTVDDVRRYIRDMHKPSVVKQFSQAVSVRVA